MKRTGTRCVSPCCAGAGNAAEGAHRRVPANLDLDHGLAVDPRRGVRGASLCAESLEDRERDLHTLKNQGYELEHNFGHGDEHLATVLLLLLLAFLIDQLQELCCPLFQAALTQDRTRYGLWERTRMLLYELQFGRWRDLYLRIIAPQVLTVSYDTS